MMMINIAISIGYKNHLLYDNISLEFPKNGVVSFIGDNGSGKSTLYKTILGIVPPISGKIPSEITRKSAVVSDYIQLPGEVRMMDIMELLGEKKVKYAKENYSMLHTYIQTIESQLIKTLSSGQKKLIEIYSALASEKKIILLDEASNSLDFKNKSLFLDEVRDLAKKDILFLHTSHDLDDVSFLGGKVYGLFKETKEITPYNKIDFTSTNLREFLGYSRRSKDETTT